MKKNKILAAILAAAMLVTLTGCTDNSEKNESSVSDTKDKNENKNDKNDDKDDDKEESDVTSSENTTSSSTETSAPVENSSETTSSVESSTESSDEASSPSDTSSDETQVIDTNGRILISDVFGIAKQMRYDLERQPVEVTKVDPITNRVVDNPCDENGVYEYNAWKSRVHWLANREKCEQTGLIHGDSIALLAYYTPDSLREYIPFATDAQLKGFYLALYDAVNDGDYSWVTSAEYNEHAHPDCLYKETTSDVIKTEFDIDVNTMIDYCHMRAYKWQNVEPTNVIRKEFGYFVCATEEEAMDAEKKIENYITNLFLSDASASHWAYETQAGTPLAHMYPNMAVKVIRNGTNVYYYILPEYSNFLANILSCIKIITNEPFTPASLRSEAQSHPTVTDWFKTH